MPNQEKGSTRGFFHQTLRNFTKLLSGGYRKIPKPSTLRPFSCGSFRERGTKLPSKMDHFYRADWQLGFEPNSAMAEEESVKKRAQAEKDAKVAEKRERQGVGGSGRRATEELELARKMKEMEMADAGDMEQVLDIEEALHYYSRLKSPVYMEIVDRFFMDMYDDFSAPPSSRVRRVQHPAALSKCITGSRRRLGSIRL
ncbi:hypothetical protein MLD38_005245 [Melastoma candidum]|uniref:Uncharacterized protein n=1 Tax=Melastoma candidum TaxID=119954 RepID=A0ACB9SD38_9MYRT|nr:hypothetical protein MLD38_005245 [Melastoma candidum]